MVMSEIALFLGGEETVCRASANDVGAPPEKLQAAAAPAKLFKKLFRVIDKIFLLRRIPLPIGTRKLTEKTNFVPWTWAPSITQIEIIVWKRDILISHRV
jgi:hypothetical protein